MNYMHAVMTIIVELSLVENYIEIELMGISKVIIILL